jgi:two-component system chemotaxis response regulator CheY
MKYCLVVDDSSVIRKVARRILEGFGFRVVEAEDCQQALDICRQSLPDAILLDWNTPVLDSCDFLRQMRALPDGDHPRVVFCVSENDVTQLTRAFRAGADDYMLKPFDRALVEAKFQEAGLI